MSYTAIVAASLNYVIGNDGKIPWHIPSDLKYFKEQTIGKRLIMGSQTYTSLPIKLKDRSIYVLSRDPDISLTDVIIINSPNVLDDIDEEIMICGGESVYDLFAPKIDRILLSLVLTHTPGDRFFNLLIDRNYRWSIKNMELAPVQEKDQASVLRIELTKI